MVFSLVLAPALAQKSGGGVGGRGGFSSPGSSIPRVNPSPSPSLPIPTPRTRDYYPTYPPDYYPSSRPYVIVPGSDSSDDGAAVVIIVIVVLGVIAFAVVRGLNKAGSGAGEPETEVARLRLAVLYSSQLQQLLRGLAEHADTGNTKGLADLVDEASVQLLREQPAWRFGSYESWRGSLQKAEGQFDQWMNETRSEYTETLRSFEGKVVHNLDYVPKAEPDGRYILVSLIVAAHGSLPKVTTPLRQTSARQAVLALSSTTPVTLLASYLAWTPEADGEALTEEDLLTGWSGLEML
jgi:uncharacterized membrane protein